MSLDLFLRGFVIGFAIAAPVGPIGVLCIRRTLANGCQSGFVSGLGAATADAVYGSIAALGLTIITSFLIDQAAWLGLIGGAFLCILGVKTFFEKASPLETTDEFHSNSMDNHISSKDSKSRPSSSLLSDYLSIFALTLTNPMTILSFVAIFAGLGLATTEASSWTGIYLVLGVFLGSASWWLLLSAIADTLRVKFLTPSGLRWVNRISGVLITGFGLFALLSNTLF